MAAASDCVDSGPRTVRSIGSIELTQLLLDAVDAAAQFINFLLTGDADVLQEVVTVALDVLSTFSSSSKPRSAASSSSTRAEAWLGSRRPRLTQSWVTPRRRSATRVVVPRPRTSSCCRGLAVSIRRLRPGIRMTLLRLADHDLRSQPLLRGVLRVLAGLAPGVAGPLAMLPALALLWSLADRPRAMRRSGGCSPF